ncbi:hypothetical protein [Cryobacterium sp. Hh7]|uniref:hypothetical protein n=1 Tax=Cryobacterium sp. Hh7 TaxID=1259159 RepID=UPI00141B9283|nr:hypothetical protein [Cryobacterium sp. Hh7]
MMFKAEELSLGLESLREYCETVLAPRSNEIDESNEFIPLGAQGHGGDWAAATPP